MKKKKVLSLSLVSVFLFSVNAFATNVEMAQIPGVTEPKLTSQNMPPRMGEMITCGGGTTIDTDSVTPNIGNLIPCGGSKTVDVEDNYTEQADISESQGVKRYTFEDDPYTILEVDSEGNTKYIQLPFEDVTIDYDKVDYKKAKYNYTNDKCIITYGNDTYVVSGKDEAGFYTTVDVNGKRYSIERYQKIADIDDYVYKGKEYEVDENGFIVGHRVEWTDWGDGRSGYDNTKLLFKKEVPFNILWRHRPLTDEEKELLYSGPGVGLKNFSTGVSDTGIANVVVNRKPEVADKEDTGVGYTKKITVEDPLDPMKAKSVKKNKNK